MKRRNRFLVLALAAVLALTGLVTATAKATPGWTPIPPGPFGPTNDWLVVREVHWTWPSVDLFYRSQWGLTTPMDFGPGALGQGTSRDGWHKADSNLPDAAQTSGELAALDIGGNIVPGQGGSLTAYLQVECPTQRVWALGIGFALVDLDPGSGVNEFIVIWPSTPGWSAELAYNYGQACVPPTGWTETPTPTTTPTRTSTPPPTWTPSPTSTATAVPPTPTATANPTATPGLWSVYLPYVEICRVGDLPVLVIEAGTRTYRIPFVDGTTAPTIRLGRLVPGLSPIRAWVEGSYSPSQTTLAWGTSYTNPITLPWEMVFGPNTTPPWGTRLVLTSTGQVGCRGPVTVAADFSVDPPVATPDSRSADR